MCIAGGKEVSSAAVSEIIKLATDGDGWTRADVKAVGERYKISEEHFRVVNQVIGDYYISPEERKTLGAIMSGKDISRLAGKGGKKLLDARFAWLRTHLTSKDWRFSETAETRKIYVYMICTLGSIDDRRATLEKLVENGDADTKAIAGQMLSILDPVQFEAVALRGLMSSGDEYTKWVVASVYKALAPRIEGALIRSEIAELEALIKKNAITPSIISEALEILKAKLEAL